MKSFTLHTGVAVPLRASNVDTDQILPAEFLKKITRTGFESGLFAEWRKNADFVLNQPAYTGVSILIAGPDFGTGSSREHAVWALQDYGFRAVFAPRFGDIFRNNAGKAGLLAGIISIEDLEKLAALIETSPGVNLTVDLEEQTIQDDTGARLARFDIDEYTRWRLLRGLDDIAITLQSEQQISDFEQTRSRLKPSLV